MIEAADVEAVVETRTEMNVKSAAADVDAEDAIETETRSRAKPTPRTRRRGPTSPTRQRPPKPAQMHRRKRLRPTRRPRATSNATHPKRGKVADDVAVVAVAVGDVAESLRRPLPMIQASKRAPTTAERPYRPPSPRPQMRSALRARR
jgi:hypothetical protein